jgi:hypothetical protein
MILLQAERRVRHSATHVAESNLSSILQPSIIFSVVKGTYRSILAFAFFLSRAMELADIALTANLRKDGNQ